MASFPIYDKGDWDAICDSCGRKYKASELRLRWDGLRVCKSDWEPRQPQDFVRAKVDLQAVPWSRPESVTPTLNLTTGTLLSNGEQYVTADATTGPFTILLPFTPTVTTPLFTITIVKVDFTTNPITINANGKYVAGISISPYLQLSVEGSRIDLQWDGTYWRDKLDPTINILARKYTSIAGLAVAGYMTPGNLLGL